MKLNIVLNDSEMLVGYDNIHLSQINDAVDGAYTEIQANIAFELAPEIVSALISKLERGGILMTTLVNIDKLTNDYCNNFIDINSFNQFTRHRNVYYTHNSIRDICGQLNLTIIEQSNNGYLTNFTIQRN